eukprot:TRINITY_DN796_c0_g1_i5.p1 TRINITY_DN796_c0_g1~~TRINITY_DN796_c0_g1_i5.p1  ORF type:complete len:338 (+),score=16.76 TRINITY_DN796_c0_g1_i5:92-1105(+)
MFQSFNGESRRTVRIPPGGYSTVKFMDQSGIDRLARIDAPDKIENQLQLQTIECTTNNSKGSGSTQKMKKEQLSDVDTEAEKTKTFLLFQLRRRGTISGLELEQKLSSMDTSGDGFVSFVEFKEALSQLSLSESQIHCLFRYFDADCNGYITKNEFLDGIFPNLNSFRKALLVQAFRKLDLNSDEVIDLAEVAIVYDLNQHPDFINGKKSKNLILTEFLQGFGKVEDGQITLKQWLHHYRFISALIERDDYFELMIRNAWKLGSEQDLGGRSNKAQRNNFVSLGTKQSQYDIGGHSSDNKQKHVYSQMGNQFSLRQPEVLLGSQRVSKITQASLALG